MKSEEATAAAHNQLILTWKKASAIPRGKLERSAQWDTPFKYRQQSSSVRGYRQHRESHDHKFSCGQWLPSFQELRLITAPHLNLWLDTHRQDAGKATFLASYFDVVLTFHQSPSPQGMKVNSESSGSLCRLNSEYDKFDAKANWFCPLLMTYLQAVSLYHLPARG